MKSSVLGGLVRKRVCCGDEVFVLTCFGRKYPFEDGNIEAALQSKELSRRQSSHFDKARAVLGFKQYDHLDYEEGEPQKTGYYKLLQPIEHYLDVWHPTEVVIPGRYDLNQDHRFLNEVCRIALRAGNRRQDPQQGPIKRVLEMIAHDRFIAADADGGYGVVLTDKMANTVVEAWRCYEDEQRDAPHVRAVQNIIARYRYWGSQFGVALAEPFRLLFETE